MIFYEVMKSERPGVPWMDAIFNDGQPWMVMVRVEVDFPY